MIFSSVLISLTLIVINNIVINLLCPSSTFRHLVCIQQRRPAPGLQPNPGPSQLAGAQASGEHPAEVADQPRAAAQLRQGRRPRQEARPQAQEESRRREEEHGRNSRLPEGLRRQRRHTTGRDTGGGRKPKWITSDHVRF